MRRDGWWPRAALVAFVLTLSGCRGGERQAPGPLARPERFGFGRAAAPAEIAAWDIDVMPDGTGLPPGRGTAAEGVTIFAARCTACHGATGREGPFDKLVGREPREGFPFGQDPRLLSERTIGNYWPYATTLFDYIRRAMPFDAPGSLRPDEIYAVVAYLLYRNEIVPEDAVLDAQSLPRVVMPARDRFVRDNRRGAEIR
ncbi:MAG: cytochrome c [Gemmatimonadetes bacterium]|nr:cytochrome c [Gemmatimonadota bacterium]